MTLCPEIGMLLLATICLIAISQAVAALTHIEFTRRQSRWRRPSANYLLCPVAMIAAMVKFSDAVLMLVQEATAPLNAQLLQTADESCPKLLPSM
jgi:hypothetical protein